jgi:hypothetical protein
MDNTLVTYDNANTEWDYSPVKFWPGLITDGSGYGHVTFFAYGGKASGDLAISLTTSGNYPKITHETPPAADQQVDLVADVLFDEYWGDANGNAVKFTFEHILSKIGFKAKLADTYSGIDEVKVTSLKVKYGSAVIKGADYNFNTGGTSHAPGSWQTTGATNFTGTDDSGELVSTSGVTLNHSTAVQLNEAGKFLMLIPQTTVTDGDLTVELEYKVTVNSEPEKTYKGSYAIPAREYAIGTAYTYTFNIVLREVVFDATIDVSTSWDAGSTGSDLNIQ